MPVVIAMGNPTNNHPPNKPIIKYELTELLMNTGAATESIGKYIIIPIKPPTIPNLKTSDRNI